MKVTKSTTYSIKKSTTYSNFIDLVSKTKKVESMRVTPTISVVCVNSDYYEVDVHKQVFHKLILVGAMSYQLGTTVPKERMEAFQKMKHDVTAESIGKARCKIYNFRRVNMV